MTDDAGALGAQLGPYRIEKLLGEGAMGEVYLAVHEALGRHVAIKTLKPAVAADHAMTERFFSEARAVNIIRHENIVECTDLVNDPTGKSYIVMELLEGRTLGLAIREARMLPPRRAARIAAQIADALGAAHDKGIVHRDLKPDNVFLIKRAGSSDYVKVLDFGMARLRPDLGGGAVATQSGALIGTPAYMSPEQARGEKAGPAADVYALGAVLFHMLTGQMPFVAPSLSLMLVAVLQETPPRVDRLAADVPAALVDLVDRTLAKDPARRPASMAAFRREVLEAAGLPVETAASIMEPSARGIASSVALDQTLDPNVQPWGQSSVSAAAGEVSKPAPARRRMWIAAGLVVAGVIVAGLMTFGTSHDSTPHESSTSQPLPVSVPAPPPPAPAPAPPIAVPADVPAPVVVAPPVEHKKPRKPAVAHVPTSTQAKQPEPTAAGSAAPAEPAKIDRTKQLVGPKPSPPSSP